MMKFWNFKRFMEAKYLFLFTKVFNVSLPFLEAIVFVKILSLDFVSDLRTNTANETEKKSLCCITTGNYWRNTWKRSQLSPHYCKVCPSLFHERCISLYKNQRDEVLFCSCDCNGEWHTLQSQRKKLKKRQSQILLKVTCGFRFAVGSQTREDITMESGNFPFGIPILQQIHLSVMLLQAIIDTNTKETGKIQIRIWSLNLPHFWSPDKGTTITSTVHRWSGGSAMPSSSFFSFPLIFFQSKLGWKIRLLLWKQCMSSDFLTNFLPWFMDLLW